MTETDDTTNLEPTRYKMQMSQLPVDPGHHHKLTMKPIFRENSGVTSPSTETTIGEELGDD